MEIKSAKFVTSLANYGPFTGKGLKQIAIAGKSNVGKSSLINGLCRAKGLAKTSSTPGKTRLINVFLINDTIHLIDLPGYGYAKVSKSEQQRWGSMMQGYFEKADELKVMLLLVDIRHEPSTGDIEMVEFLRAGHIPFIVAATKADKLSRAQRQRSLMIVARTLLVQPWEITPWSSQTGEGREALLAELGKHLD
ncbi:MAG: ribosome biogenesis GTP-binding protein YihA/YsxC [Eubacteriales bacterium]|jgi:GTP-binding protein|nr:ribosome biogenesis GTP-binding protein YihA/YsxC [Eubacteriales bacterium]MDD4105148.1 ribosome biogenesis GTP-binding protein YihA/YsxC [Eubacteriales bacterium]MDD4711022.1 ribosome biogenesis GTP-binding protein YihA/YsxC [Eubacteriales bacterium]NLO14863.1 YihA family ribosome biogenesis GTP-binding protein [Clostridiales bacterium]